MKRFNIKKRLFFYCASFSVMIFTFFDMKCNASCINIDNEQETEAIFEENQQDFFLSIESDLQLLYEENYLNEIIHYMNQNDYAKNVDFQEVWELILKGDILSVAQRCFRGIGNTVITEFKEGKSLFASLFLFSVLGALLNIITDVLETEQTAEIGRFFLYFFMIVILGRQFLTLYDQAFHIIESIIEFVHILLPAYAVTIGLSGNPSYALMYYELVIFAVYLVENLLLKIILPTIEGYVLLLFVAGIWKEERMKILLSTFKKTIEICLKLFLWVLGSIGILQSMISPAMDTWKYNGIKKMIAAIPGVGAMSEGISDIFLGSALLIKNSVGVLFSVILLMICVVPLIKMLVYMILIKLAGALGGMVNPSGLSNTTNQVADAGFLLWKAVFTAMGLFLMSIAVSVLAVRGAI